MEAPRAFNPYHNPFTLPIPFPPPLPPLPLPVDPTMESSSMKKKIKIQWLEDDAQRRATLKKRKQGIIKKAEELHILCSVRTCVVIYGPGEVNPEVWPSIEEAVSMCRSFKQLPEVEQGRMKRTHAQFLHELIGKKNQQLWHQHDEIIDAQARCHIYDGIMGSNLRGINREGLVRVHAMIRGMLRERYEWCRAMREQGQSVGDDAAQRASPPEEPPMEELVDKFLYGDDVAPEEGSTSWEDIRANLNEWK